MRGRDVRVDRVKNGVGPFPRFVLGGGENRPQGQTDARTAPVLRGRLLHALDVRLRVRERLTPQRVDVGVLGRYFYRDV